MQTVEKSDKSSISWSFLCWAVPRPVTGSEEAPDSADSFGFWAMLLMPRHVRLSYLYRTLEATIGP